MPSKTKELNILFLDDEKDNLEAFTFNCEMFWKTYTMTSPIEVMNGNHPIDTYDAIIVDLVFKYPEKFRPDLKIDPIGGLSFLDWMQKNHPNTPVMVLSAYVTDEIRNKIKEKYPRVLCKDKPLDFSSQEFRKLMKSYIAKFRS